MNTQDTAPAPLAPETEPTGAEEPGVDEAALLEDLKIRAAQLVAMAPGLRRFRATEAAYRQFREATAAYEAALLTMPREPSEGFRRGCDSLNALLTQGLRGLPLQSLGERYDARLNIGAKFNYGGRNRAERRRNRRAVTGR